jgi:hypothetical protein
VWLLLASIPVVLLPESVEQLLLVTLILAAFIAAVGFAVARVAAHCAPRRWCCGVETSAPVTDVLIC